MRVASEDLLNPITLAFLMKSGQAPSTQDLEAARRLLGAATAPPQAPGDPGPPAGAPQAAPDMEG